MAAKSDQLRNIIGRIIKIRKHKDVSFLDIRSFETKEVVQVVCSNEYAAGLKNSSSINFFSKHSKGDIICDKIISRSIPEKVRIYVILILT